MKQINFKKITPQWWMMAGCGAVMVSVFLLLLAGGSAGWGLLLFVLCPLMHIFMHNNMHHGANEHKEDMHPKRLENTK